MPDLECPFTGETCNSRIMCHALLNRSGIEPLFPESFFEQFRQEALELYAVATAVDNIVCINEIKTALTDISTSPGTHYEAAASLASLVSQVIDSVTRRYY